MRGLLLLFWNNNLLAWKLGLRAPVVARKYVDQAKYRNYILVYSVCSASPTSVIQGVEKVTHRKPNRRKVCSYPTSVDSSSLVI